MTRPVAAATLAAGAELLGWWAVLTALWIVLISSVDTLEWVVGALSALLAACAARAARRASRGR
ncbi:hypothetical protein [Streptomyces gilvosporeus]|uniref:Uncharacterized protein n=1 Tax=Streptomyces gilvosporeus TaxID=553510 RepID=A0A1V0TML3_9ACTN|nr:hypothetical protein [Streptomyces gilvosporeus]ARF54167.1 hypothetical protein B1H19_08120 [Streptomyces gilvosporeus]